MANAGEAQVSDLMDREAIRDIIARYNDVICRNDIDAVVDLFAQDGSMEVDNGPLAGNAPVGRKQLHAFYLVEVKKMTPRPFAHHHVVDLHGDGRATGRSYVEPSCAVPWIIPGSARSCTPTNT